jgi:phosphatidylserine/phosphatidylglycerophosphate/cardiolipin synthase-like enzyme
MSPVLFLALLPVCASLLLCACSLLPKSDGVALEHVADLEDVNRIFRIEPLRPGSSSPLTEQTVEQLKKTDPRHRLQGITYGLSYGNALDRQWLVQSPNVWGARAGSLAVEPLNCEHCDADLQLYACSSDNPCAVGKCVALHASVTHPGEPARDFCVGHSDLLIDRFYDLVVSAQHAVDIVWLQPPADDRFLAALRNAITEIAASGRSVTLRVMIGTYPPSGSDANALLGQLVRDAADVKASRLRLFVGITRSCNGDKTCQGLSWNHAKVVAVDGTRALVGGHNVWTEDYLLDAPVHDVSMELAGPAARDAHGFADALWDFVCHRPRTDQVNQALRFFMHGKVKRSCLSAMPLPPRAEGRGRIRVLAVGRLGKGIESGFADQSLVARALLLGAATRSIRMIQQDVAFSLNGIDAVWPDAVLERFSDLITERGGDVYVVLSNLRAAGPVGNYSNGISLETVAKRMLEVAQQRSRLSRRSLVDLICKHFHVAPLRFGPDDSWLKKRPIGLHAKFWMVDERAFYIGSENLYPVNLQEFGYVVEDAEASAQVRRAYWEPAWKWSSRAAISGSEARACVLRPSPAGNRVRREGGAA